MKLLVLFGLCLTAALLTACASTSPSSIDPRREFAVNRVNDGRHAITMIESGDTFPLASLPPEAKIYEFSVAPSGSHAYVHYGTPWPDNHNAPYEQYALTLDLDARKEIARIGFPWNAEVKWTIGDDLWYRESRGTGVGVVTIRSLTGEVVNRFTTSGVTVSPDGRFMAAYPIDLLHHPVVVTDLLNNQVIYDENPTGDDEMRYRVDQLDWERGRLVYTYRTADTPHTPLLTLGVVDLSASE